MNTPTKPAARRAVVAVLALIGSMIAVVLGATPAAASHYRANQLTWHAGGAANQVEFHLTGSWRCSFYIDPCTYAPGDVVTSQYIDPGDGGFVEVEMTAVAVDPANDVVTAEGHAVHTYAAPGAYVASSSDCCRLSSYDGHMNNGDGEIRYETLVDLSKTSASPVGLVPPIVDCPVESTCTFSVPASDPDSQPMKWRLATAEEAAGDFGTFTQPTGATVDANSGLYTWDTRGAALAESGSTFYSTQVMIENVVGGVMVSRAAVDFFIRLGSNSTNAQPVFTSPTPANGAVLNAVLGAPFSFTVAASDPDATDVVTPSAIGLPTGATFTPTPGNPAGGTFAWTPNVVGDHNVTLLAADDKGLGAVPRTVTIRVTSTNPPPVVDAGPDRSGPNRSEVTLDGTVTDTEAVTTKWTATPLSGVPAGATCTFANPDAVDTTVSCTSAGTWTLTLTADDGTNPPVSDTAVLTLTNPAPDVDAGPDKAGAEGSTITLDATVGDTEPVTTTWKATAGAGVDAGASCTFADPGAVDTTVRCTDDGTWTLELTGDDGVNPPVGDTLVLTVTNAAPGVTITAPAAGTTTPTGTVVALSATTTDAGSNDTRTCSIAWGDGTSGAGTMTGGTCTGSHTYAAAGTPTITVTVTDDDGGSTTATRSITVTATTPPPPAEELKVTGGGWLDEGRDKARFGFVARSNGTGYRGKITVRVHGDKFKGTTVTALSVSGKTATWAGTGRWNGKNGYSFSAEATDHGKKGRKGKKDKLVIKVKDARGKVVLTLGGQLTKGQVTIH